MARTSAFALAIDWPSYGGQVGENGWTQTSRRLGLSPALTRAAAADQGLYRSSDEHDACGVGFVADIKGRRSHAIVRHALDLLINLEHRGACGADPNTGDGAGILVQMPDRFLRDAIDFPLPPAGAYGAGLVFLPTDRCRRAPSFEIW